MKASTRTLLIGCIAHMAAAFVNIPAAQAAPAWANYTAQRACENIRRGMSANKAGETAAYQAMAAGYGSPMIAANNNGTLEGTLGAALAATCPQTLMNAR